MLFPNVLFVPSYFIYICDGTLLITNQKYEVVINMLVLQITQCTCNRYHSIHYSLINAVTLGVRQYFEPLNYLMEFSTLILALQLAYTHDFLFTKFIPAEE